MTTEAVSGELAPPPTHASTVWEGEGEVTLHGHWREIVGTITDGLQQRGVQDNPARLIAWRAVRNGMSATAALDVFDAHVLDAERAGAKSPVGVAVSRMLQTSRITPAPAWALTEVARRNRQRAWEERQTQLEVTVEQKDANGVEGNRGAVIVPEVEIPDATATLWQQVLGDIKLQVTRATFTQRFQGTWLEQEGDIYIVRSRDAATVAWLEHRLHRMISNALQRWGGVDIAPRFACG